MVGVKGVWRPQGCLIRTRCEESTARHLGHMALVVPVKWAGEDEWRAARFLSHVTSSSIFEDDGDELARTWRAPVEPTYHGPGREDRYVSGILLIAYHRLIRINDAYQYASASDAIGIIARLLERWTARVSRYAGRLEKTMSAWGFDEDNSSARSAIQSFKRGTGGASFQVKKHAFFAADDDYSTRSGEQPSSRRKQSSTGRKELILDDDDDEQQPQSQLQQPGRSSERDERMGSSKAAGADAPLQQSSDSLKSVKVDETGIPEIIHTMLRTKVAQPSSHSSSSSSSSASSSVNAVSASSSNKKRVSIADLSQDTTDQLMHYLIREFLKLHVADDAVVCLFEKERPVQAALDEKEAKKLFERITGHQDASSRSKSAATGGSTSSPLNEKPRSLLEQFFVVWNETTHKRKCERPSSSSSRRSNSSCSRQTEAKPESAIDTGAKKKSQEKSSTARKKKPMLNVITASDELDNVDTLNNQGGDDNVGVDYNRLNHPGSTPKPQGAAAVVTPILGDPGSTPKARASDLKALGFDEEELNTPVPIENTEDMTRDDVEADTADHSSLSEYAKKKRVAMKHSKHVSLGESGSTPTKEYIFFRETPPSFVTETVEAAVDVFKKLGLDPAFRQQAAAPQEKFVELQSSEVSKYKIGQEVQNLGAKRDVSGVVSKIFGSRQCGSSGPGTIVIDTCPTGTESELGSAPVAATAPEVSALDNEDEDLMTELA